MIYYTINDCSVPKERTYSQVVTALISKVSVISRGGSNPSVSYFFVSRGIFYFFVNTPWASYFAAS